MLDSGLLKAASWQPKADSSYILCARKFSVPVTFINFTMTVHAPDFPCWLGNVPLDVRSAEYTSLPALSLMVTDAEPLVIVLP